MKELLKNYTKKLFAYLDQLYWSLDKRRRHIVGWTLVFATLTVAGVCLWGIGQGIYNAYVAVSGWFAPDAPADAEPDVSSLDWYSGNYKHRTFRCGELNKKRNVNLHREFKAINDVHLIAARRLGVAPIASRNDLEKVKGKLVHLKDTRFYCVDVEHMTHSVPYLVPDAADFLTALGERWQEYHGTASRFIVTSCLRTERDVKRLRRGNVNATKDSCHRYGTTFDITYDRFDRHGRITHRRLKADLARALYDMQEAGHCYVKYEYQQKCFHVTVRPR